MPLTFLFVGLTAEEILNQFNKLPNKLAALLSFIVISIFCFALLNHGEIERMHTFREENIYRASRMHNQKALIETSNQLKRRKVDVLLNCGYLGNGIVNMYYTDLIAYDKIPDEEEFNMLRKNKIKTAIFDDGKLPEYILKNDSILLLPDKIKRTGM